MSENFQQTVTICFDNLAKQLEPTLFEFTAVTRCQSKVETYLRQYISTFTTVLPGAFARKTMVSPIKGSVVDMFILFKKENSHKFTPFQLLSKLEVTLREEYPGALYDEETESIYVPIDDLELRIQPGFLTDGTDYLIPEPGKNSWLSYDALGYESYFAKENAKHKGKLVHVIRMMKMWNRMANNLFDGYFLELLVKDVLVDYEIRHYSKTINFIFKAILSAVALKKHDPANVSLQVKGLHDLDNVVNAMIHVKSAYLVSRMALEMEANDQVVAAIANWEKLLPVYMPD